MTNDLQAARERWMRDSYPRNDRREAMWCDAESLADAYCELDETELIHLRAENERLRAALEKFADESNWNMAYAQQTDLYRWIGLGLPPLEIAAEALRGEGWDK